jgi:predicted aconitase with swiveling domain
MERLKIQGRPIISGSAKGSVLISSEPLSFWGGYDWKSGEITDRRHPLSGENAKGKVLAIPFTRGSSTTTAVLLEAIIAETAPAAIITTVTDFFFALASVVADEMYAKPLPLISVSESDFARLTSGDQIEINDQGIITVHR